MSKSVYDLTNSTDLFPNLSVSGLLDSNCGYDLINQFVRSSDSNFSFNTSTSSDITPQNPTIAVANDISTNLNTTTSAGDNNNTNTNNNKSADKNGAGDNKPLYNGYSSLKLSDLYEKYQATVDSPPLMLPSLAPIDPELVSLPTMQPHTNENNTQAKTVNLGGLSHQLQRRLSIHKETAQEPKMVPKKKRTQEKNRQAAQQFRKRQKLKVIELKTKTEQIEAENNNLRFHIEGLFAENKMLTEQLVYWKNLVASGILITPESNQPEARQRMMEEYSKIVEKYKFA